MSDIIIPSPTGNNRLNDVNTQLIIEKVNLLLRELKTNLQDTVNLDHNDLQSIQGGDTDEYYHLDATEFGFLDGQNQAVKTTDDVTFNSLTTTGGRKPNTTRITSSPYTALATDDNIFVDTDGGAITVNLPVGINRTKYRLINCGSSGNDITLAPNGAELLTGVNASRTISDGGVLIVVYETTEGWW